MGSMIPSMDKISAEIERIDEQIRHTQHFLEISPEYERYKSIGDFRKKFYKKKHGDFLQDYNETYASYAYLKKVNGGTKFKSVKALKSERDRLIDEKKAKNQAYSAEKKKLSQMEYCRSELDKYLPNERNAQQRKHKRSDLE